VTDLGNFSGMNIDYSVRDNYGTEQFNGVVSLQAKDCKSVQLKW